MAEQRKELLQTVGVGKNVWHVTCLSVMFCVLYCH